MIRTSQAVVPVSVLANSTAEQTLTLAGALAASDEVLRIIKPTHQAGLSIGNARITTNGQVIVQYINNTGSPIVPTSETYVVYTWRR